MMEKILDSANIVHELTRIAEGAGKIINECVKGSPLPEYRVKPDLSPVTAADEAANTFIVDALQTLGLRIPIIAEESLKPITTSPLDGGDFWLVDPLDGTKEFIAGREEFTVNIALIRDEKPLIGVVHLPAKDVTYTGRLAAGAFKREGAQTPVPIGVRTTPLKGATVIASRSHFNAATKAWLSQHKIAKFCEAGSSLKFCRVAEGAADLYPRLGNTMEWDTAAGHAILSAAGGKVETLQRAPLRYGKPNFSNPHFVASGR